MTSSMLRRLPIFSRRFHQGADARLMGQPRDARKGALWLAGWDEGDDLINRVKQRTVVNAGLDSESDGTGVSRRDEYERNGSSVVAFFVTFVGVFVAYFPLGIVSQNFASLLKPSLIEPFMWSDWPLLALVGAFAGLICGLWQADIASYPRGNAAGKRLWWQ